MDTDACMLDQCGMIPKQAYMSRRIRVWHDARTSLDINRAASVAMSHGAVLAFERYIRQAGA